METNIETTYQDCPECRASIPVNAEFVTWCEHCGWNMQPLKQKEDVGLFERAYETAGARQSQRLLDTYKNASALQPRLSFARIAALLLAGLVHLSTGLLALLGIYLLVAYWPNYAAIIGGLLCLGIVWELRPRFNRLPDDALIPSQFPALYGLVAEVAAALKASPPSAIVVDGAFNAGMGEAGWRGKTVLYLGLPLWSILDDQERLALLAHELAHQVNGDNRRTMVVRVAWNSLARWYRILHPGSIWESRTGPGGLLLIPVNLVRMLLAGLIWLVAYLLVLLLAGDSQRAEYLADHLAAQAAGTEAVLGMMDKLHLYPSYETTVRRVALGGEGETDIFTALRQRLASVPARERERIRRVQKLEGSRLDSSHPPTTNRLELLQHHFVSQPALAASSLPFDEVARELAQVEERVERKLVGLWESRLYWR